MYEGIKARGVTNRGFTVISTDPVSSFHHTKGGYKMRGMYRRKDKKKVPERPFMGFNETNNQRVAKILRDYIDTGKG
jgi:phage gpG-like protein